jgi:hypothetical protein
MCGFWKVKPQSGNRSGVRTCLAHYPTWHKNWHSRLRKSLEKIKRKLRKLLKWRATPDSDDHYVFAVAL